MAHHHAHRHDDHVHDGHTHGPVSYGRAFFIAAVLNTVFIVAEVLYGLKANSLALLADAGHNVSDVLGLLLSWGAWHMSKRAPSSRYTYGLRSTSILAALVNSLLLFVAISGIAWEAIQRFGTEQPVAGSIVMGVAALGIAINGFTAFLFARGQHDLNIKATFLHLASDAAVSAAVVVVGFVIIRTGWLWLDPVISLAIAAVILIGSWGLLRDAVKLALHAVPTGIDSAEVQSFLAAAPAVCAVHDLHIWGMSTTETALSAHLVMTAGHPGDGFLETLALELHEKFAIGHTTIQIEVGDGTHPCVRAPLSVV